MQANDVRVVERNKFLSEKLDGARERQRNDECGMMNDELKTSSPLSIHHSSFIVHRFFYISRALIGKAFYTSSL
jgi:hypothetical protein